MAYKVGAAMGYWSYYLVSIALAYSLHNPAAAGLAWSASSVQHGQ